MHLTDYFFIDNNNSHEIVAGINPANEQINPADEHTNPADEQSSSNFPGSIGFLSIISA